MHPIPLSDRISLLYLEHGTLEQDGHALTFHREDGAFVVPSAKTTVLMLGPGVSVTHAAIRLASGDGVLMLWVGEAGVRIYGVAQAHRPPDPLLLQANCHNDRKTRLAIARRVFYLMFGDEAPVRFGIDQLRGLEGSRVKQWYQEQAGNHGIEWAGRSRSLMTPIDRSLAGCNAALYGLTEAVIIALGYSPSIGFVHSGDPRSFVFDLADTVKFKTVAPLAFDLAAEHGEQLTEGLVRRACRDMFYGQKIADRLIDHLEHLFSSCRSSL